MQVSKRRGLLTITRDKLFLIILTLPIMIIPSAARAQNKAATDPAVTENASSKRTEKMAANRGCGADH